jgi:hypothetical protein
MSKPKTKKMVALKVLETSGVDHPAHLEEGWIVMKSANTQENPHMEQGLEEAYIERVVELEKALAASHDLIANLEKKYGEMEDDEEEMEDEEEDDMMKSLPEPVREMLAKAQAETDAIRAELQKERDDRRDAEFVAKAASWEHLTVNPKEIGPALRQLTDIAPALATQVEKALEAANAQAESANIFEEIGRGSAPTNGNAFSQIQSLAKSAFDKGEFPTMEQAVSAVVQQNPDLYAAHRNESL